MATNRSRLVLVSSIAIVGLCINANAQTLQSQNSQWRTGPALEQFLQSPISVSFAEVPLRSRLYEFARQQQFAIFVDRRLDPLSPLTLAIRNVTTEQMLWTLAELHQFGVCRLDDVFYIGPVDTAASLPILWSALEEETKKLSRLRRVNWRSNTSLSVPKLAVPDEILQQLADQNRFKVIGDRLPHDLWPALELPPLTIDKQVALLVVGFDRWYERSADGSQIRLTEFPTIDQGKIEFGQVENGKGMLADLRKQVPDCKISQRGNLLTATGPPLQLATIRSEIVKSQQPLPVRNDDQHRYTLSTRATRGSILATIANQLGKELKFEPSLKDSLNETIELTVKEVSLTQLLEQTLAGTNARYAVEDDRLEIFKK